MLRPGSAHAPDTEGRADPAMLNETLERLRCVGHTRSHMPGFGGPITSRFSRGLGLAVAHVSWDSTPRHKNKQGHCSEFLLRPHEQNPAEEQVISSCCLAPFRLKDVQLGGEPQPCPTLPRQNTHHHVLRINQPRDHRAGLAAGAPGHMGNPPSLQPEG
eukprot:CAMPEP_0168469490 /NCGR_PEP_ID=MMETSP0228-20121227/58244_1 /TAXON_ID=133427 /ORGANISM="Protoceratium reticulatum, Strain CCCM 535 (=CCMP 1889)" /LENGTH=158 /DNA_ID=CAMNT_0008485271 /DNA_START=302 /DNA_END=778 /DNA_ORIENTATION=-